MVYLAYMINKSQKGNAFLGLLLCIGLLIVIGWYLFVSPYSPLLAENRQDASERISEGSEYTVEMTEKGFAPKDIIVKRFDTVTFVNKGVQPHWPASDNHPEHLVCPGFDALRALQGGEKYSIVFEEAKTCPFHDHLNPAFKGVITVKR